MKKISAVVDRISGGKQAVLLAEEEKQEFVVFLNDLQIPLYEGQWVDLYLDESGEIQELHPNEKKTEERKQRVDSLMRQLKNRKRSQYKQ